MDTIYEADIDWDAELRAEVEEAEEAQREHFNEVASCCGGRDKWCAHYGYRG